MKIDKYISGDFMAHTDVETEDIITFLDEGEENETSEGRKMMTFKVKLPSGETKKASPNKTSIRALASSWGIETSEWIGRQAKITKSRENVRGELKWVIYLEPTDKKTDIKKEDDIPIIESEEKDNINVDEIGF